MPYRSASWTLWREHRVFVPYATIQNWVEAGGKKASGRIDTDYLDWALSDFSGYIAADELYDGPFCILSIVDNRTFKRLAYQVLDHDPTHEDIEAFFGRFRPALKARGLSLKGITTDGSALYPEPIATVFGEVPHQLCTFHVLKEVTKAVLGAVAKLRKGLAANAPKLGRGRPASKAARCAARRKKRIERKVGDLFEHRYLFVRRHLGLAERKTFERITRGQPHCAPAWADGRGLSAVRSAMPDGDGVGQVGPGSGSVATVRTAEKGVEEAVRAGLEKAMVFLDEKLLGSTSNAVERGNRRYRKMQKSVYRVRTRRAIEVRLALDLIRERQAQGRAQTTETLHRARAA